MRYITTAEVADVVLRRYDSGDIADVDLIADPMSPVTWKIRYKGRRRGHSTVRETQADDREEEALKRVQDLISLLRNACINNRQIWLYPTFLSLCFNAISCTH